MVPGYTGRGVISSGTVSRNGVVLRICGHELAMGGGVSNSSGSGSEDGDAEWKAAIDSAATMDFGISTSKGFNAECHSKVLVDDTGPLYPKTEEDMHDKRKPQSVKLYQIKVYIGQIQKDEACNTIKAVRSGILVTDHYLCKTNPINFSNDLMFQKYTESFSRDNRETLLSDGSWSDAQKLLEDFLDKSLVVVRKPFHNLDDGHLLDESGIQLFRLAPPGIVFDPIDEVSRPRKRPKLCPGVPIDEKSEKCRLQLQSVVVDGLDIMASARDACQKSLARFEARVAKTKAAFQQEEERVAELKRIRGEKWLPSIAREMQGN